MLLSMIDNLKRSIAILDDLPNHIQKERGHLLSSINDLFEDFQDQFQGNKDALKKITTLKIEVFKQIESFCDTACEGVKEDVRIVEE